MLNLDWLLVHTSLLRRSCEWIYQYFGTKPVLLFRVECNSSFSDTCWALGFKYMRWSGFIYVQGQYRLYAPTNTNWLIFVFYFLKKIVLIYLLTFYLICKSQFYLCSKWFECYKVLYQIVFFQNINYTIYILLMECLTIYFLLSSWLFCNTNVWFVSFVSWALSWWQTGSA